MSAWSDRAAAVVRAIDAALPAEHRTFDIGMQAVVARWRSDDDRLVVRADFAVQEGETEQAADELIAAVGQKPFGDLRLTPPT